MQIDRGSNQLRKAATDKCSDNVRPRGRVSSMFEGDGHYSACLLSPIS